MPFTFSHPALVIPLLQGRRFSWLSATGLLAGSVAPDFEKFFRLHLASGHSHTLASIFYFSLPVSVALAFVFHQLVRRALVVHLPPGLQRRVSQYQEFDWPRYFRQHYGSVLLSIVLGAVSHLFWDAFTHPNALMRSLPAAAARLHFAGRVWDVYRLSGVINSVLGALAIAWGVWRMPQMARGYAPARASFVGYWALVCLVAGALLVLWLFIASSYWIDFGITAISASMMGVLVASVWFRPAARQRVG